MELPLELRMEGVGLQIWRLAANILNKQSWTADKERSFYFGFWCEANNPFL